VTNPTAGNYGWVYNQNRSVSAGKNCGLSPKLPCSPKYWGSYAPTCNSQAQSPINIQNYFIDSTLTNIEAHADGPCYDLDLINNAHAWEVELSKTCLASYYISWQNSKYFLQQLHFHSPSENTVEGKFYDGEMHLVHTSSTGKVLVLGVLLEESTDSEENPLFKLFLHRNFTQSGAALEIEVPLDPYDAILPGISSYWTWWGSLTTPPCTEGVRWILMTETMKISTNDLNRMRFNLEHRTVGTQVSDNGDNNRPVQDLNGRVLGFFQGEDTVYEIDISKESASAQRASFLSVSMICILVIFLQLFVGL